MATSKKITETGPIGLRGIRNSDLYGHLNSLASSGDPDAIGLLNALSSRKSRPFGPNDDVGGYFEPQAMPQGTPYASLGDSKYDEPYIIGSDPEQVNEIRYENQPWYDTLANGVGKMLGTAGTTFISSLVGLPYGIGAVINQGGRMSAIWDNSVTKGLADVDSWLEENMTNYKSKEQKENPWYDPSNLFSMNFIADDVIKNAGFTVGAAASMAVGSGALGLLSRSLGFVNKVGGTTKMAANTLGALFSATGEGMIEARHGVDNRNKIEKQRLRDALTPEYNALQAEEELITREFEANRGKSLVQTGDGRLSDPAYDTYKQKMEDLAQRKNELDQKMQAGIQQIEESGLQMGNTILLANQGLLTINNMLQFSKAMTKSFDRARHMAESTEKYVKPFGVRAARTAEGTYKTSGKNFGRVVAAVKSPITEGSEEMNQQWIQSSAEAAYNEKDANDYWRAKLDKDSYRETSKGLYTMGNILDKGFQDSWGDAAQWEQFVVGALTGFLGSYSPTKIFNPDTNYGVLDPRRYGSWEGGSINAIHEFDDQYKTFSSNIDDVNKVLQQEDFPSRVKNLVAHTYLEGQKENAANNNDIKAWKDADDKQTIHDIQAFIRAGKLDDLKAIYDEMGADLSDEDIENIVKSTTREISAEEDKANFDQQIDEQIAAKQREIDAIQEEQVALDTSRKTPTEDYGEVNQEFMQMAKNDEKIAKIEKEITDLNQQKEKYVGQKKFIGSFVDDKGNRTHTNDDIRQEIKHNTSELNRKLNSYLDSIAIVNDMTNGNLSKDQEDNLAYLHNLSKEKTARFDKIMAKVRKQLPNNFLLKTSKTPEQLSKEFASSDLAFKQDENTPKGYVEVDTSLMNDKNFGVFFMDKVMRGDNIEAEPAEEDNKKEEEKDEKKKTVAQEKREKQIEKDKEEQQNTNVANYRKHFYDSMRQNTNMTLDEIRQAFEALKKDIYDASVLENESQEFYNTYLDYMLSPQKANQDQEKETQKVVNEQQKESVKDSSIRELAQRTDLKELLAKAKEDSDIPLINKIKKAMLLRQQQAKTQSAARDTSVLAGYNPADKEAAVQAQMRKLEKQLDVVEDSDRELTMQELADRLKGHDVLDVQDVIKENLNPVDQATLKQLEQADPVAFDKRMEEMTNTVLQAMDDLESNLLSNLPDIDESRIGSSEEAVQALTDKLGKENPEGPAVPKKQDEVNPIISVPIFDTEAPTKQDNIETVSDATVLDEDKRQGVSGVELQRSGQHPWRAVTRRVGYKSNVPYSEYLEGLINTTQDPEEAHRLQKQLRRVITLEKVLEEKGAFSRVEQGKVSKGNIIKFAVSKAVNEEAGDFVIFMTDEQGNILADLPSSDPEIEPTTNEIAGLADLYEEARKQWDALADEEKDKTEFVQLKGLSTKVDYTYFGKVKYQDQRQSLNELFGSEKFTLAIKVSNNDSSSPVAFLDTGKKNLQGKTQRDKIREPLTGTKGQPYVLIPTSKANKDNARGEGYLAVPILTPTFGELSNDSKFYQVVKDLLERIKSGKVQTKQAKELLSNLFGVSNVHVNFDGDITKKGSGITITTFARTNQSEKGNSHTVFKGSKEEMDIDAILEALGRFYINISNKKINTTEPFYTLSNGEKVYYNNMIGEIATTNAAMPHTVNDFFTVVPLEKKDGKFQQVAKKPARMKFPVGNMNSVFHVKVKYKDGTQKMWSIHPSEGFECRDEQGRPIYKEDKIHTASEKKLAAQYRAEAFGRFYMKDFSNPFAVMIDDKAYLYNPADRTFKSAKELESTYPRYNKNLSEYDALQDMLTSMEAARQEAEEAGVIAGNANKEKESLRKEGDSILRKLGYKSKDRHSNGHVRGGQSGWKLRFIVKNPATGKAFTQDEVNADKDAYFKAALPLLNWLKEYFKNPDGTDEIQMHKPQSDGYTAHYQYKDKDGNIREPFKFLSGGEVGESDFTIYIGSIEDVDKFMSDVENSPINDSLAVGNNNKSDTDFNGKIHGRIEGRSIGFSGYMLPEGLQNMLPLFSVVYEDDRVEISVVEGSTEKHEYLIKDKKNGKYYAPSYTSNATEDTAIGYVNKNSVKIRTKIAENVYGNFIIAGNNSEEKATKNKNVSKVNATITKLQNDGAKFGSAITDYSYGAQDKLPTFYGTLPSTGERIRVEINERNNRYDIWVDRAVPGQVEYEPGKGINYNILVEEGEESYNKALQELGLPTEFLNDIPKLNELYSNDVRNETDTHDEYLKNIWGIEYGHNAYNYKNINRVNDTINKLQKDGAKFTVCDVNGKEDPNGDFYKDENDLLHARVTSMAEGDPQVEPFKETLEDGKENPWIKPSTTIGNQVDEFIRVFFEGGDPMSTNTHALSESSKNKLLEDLKQIQKSITKQGWKVASRNIVASGIIGVTDANGDQLVVRVAGTLDLLLYNPEKDEYAIYDIKTHRSTIDFDNVDKDSHISKWSAQLSLYKELLEAKYPEMKGKIVGLKIIPIKVSQDSYDADVHTYTERDNHLYDENEKEVKAVFNYDGQTIPISERALKINMGKKGFKASYNSKEGRNQIIISKPRPLPGEAPKQKVKEGILKVINKVSDKRSISDYLKQSHKGLPEAVALCATIDEARKNGTLADLMLTEATMNMLSDMLNESLIDKHAALDKLNLSGLAIPGNIEDAGNPALPNAPKGVPIDDSLSPETLKEKATERGIVDKTTEKAWERLSEENKQKVANTANHIQVKKALQDAQRNPRKDPNKLVGEYLHRKAVETSGYKKLNIQKELEWLNKVLPQLSRLNKVRIVEGLIRCSDGTWDYGQLRNGLLYIGTNGKEGTVYHEAFHAVTQWLLTDTELDALYEAARERYGNLDVVSLEERLADDFMAYTMGVKPSYKPRHRNIFQKLWDAIKKMLGHTSMIDKLYQNINDGVYAGAVLRFGDNEFADITSEDREVSMRYNFLDREQVARLQEGQVTKEQYEVLDSNEKRYLFHCVL